jgi:hypothetical protein
MSDYSFTYPVFNEGEIISSEKLTKIPKYLQYSLVRCIFEEHRGGRTHDIRSGVLNGFNIIPLPEPMTVRLSGGLGFAVRPDNTLEPVINKDTVEVQLLNPDQTEYFWQIISLVPFNDYDQYAQRLVRNPDGSIGAENLPEILNYSFKYHIYSGDLDPSNPPLPTGTQNEIVVAAILTHPSKDPYVIDSNDIYDTRIFLADTEGTTFDYYCVGQWLGQPPAFTRHIEKTNTRNIQIIQSLQPIENLTGHYHAQFAIPKALGTCSYELINTTVDYPGVAFANVVFINGYYPLDTEAHVQIQSTTQNLPYWLVDLYVRIRDRNTGEFYDIQNEYVYLQVKATFPRYD